MIWMTRRRVFASCTAVVTTVMAGGLGATRADRFDAWADDDLRPILQGIEERFGLTGGDRSGAEARLASLAGQPERVVDCAGCILTERQALELWLAV